MKKFNEDFLKQRILVVSDKEVAYADDELKYEQNFIETFMNEIKSYGMRIDYIEVENEAELKTQLSKYDPKDTIIYNWCERFNYTDGTEAEVTKVYEELGYTFTGASTELLDLCANKFKVKTILQNAGVNVPKFYLVEKHNVGGFNTEFDKKYFVKSNRFHASTEITADNVVDNKTAYLKVANKIALATDANIVVEEFVSGEEYTCIVWGNHSPTVLPTIHIGFAKKDTDNVYTNSAKFDHDSKEYQDNVLEPAELDANKAQLLEHQALQAYKALGFTDYARFDLREMNGKYFIIDANVNPYINKLSNVLDSEVLIATEEIGYTWGETILQICEFAYTRNNKL